jgi:asparagine synthase (glutamine-hydrolysing)
MCGIAGILDPSGVRSDELPSVAAAMAGTLEHRGPDDHGVWSDPEAGIAFGHRRLAVVDLSEEGRQPMASASGRYVIAYNGEIYNHQELRSQLEALGHRFRGRSDTEVLLAAVTQWGAREALGRLNGMFAYALWDRSTRQLLLARDRVGEKPIYYGRVGSALLFASELKAFRVHPRFVGEVDRDSLASFFRYKYVPAPRSIYRGVRKLPPGSLLVVGPEDEELPAPVRYWDVEGAVRRGLDEPFRGSPDEAAAELEEILRDAVRLRMQADVPLGAFLSGGIDSSTVVALMQTLGDRPARTFTIGSTDRDLDEARYARAVAAHLGTDHTELLVTPQETMDVIPRLPTMYDEPFADSSQIPTFLVSRLAREHVTVSLSGDGGDELFGGYDRYLWVGKIWDRVGWVPAPLRRSAARAMASVSPAAWQRVFAGSDRLLSRAARHQMVGEKVHKLATVLDAHDPDEMYLRLVSHWQDPGALVTGAGETRELLRPAAGSWRPTGVTERMMYMDLLTYLPDDILTKVDRASMSVSLEARVPLLDHRVVEFAWSLPLAMKLREGRSKWLLRRVLARHVPEALTDRPKTGFGIPISAWLRGPLREWAENLLDERRLRSEGFLHADLVRTAWREHLSGRFNRQYAVWDVLMFESWLEAQRGTHIASSLLLHPAREAVKS